METAHAVNAASRRGRRGTEIYPWDGCAIGAQTQYRPRDDLKKISRATVDITTHEIGVAAFEFRTIHHMPRQYAPGKPGSKSLDLTFHVFRHVCRRSIRHVRVSPGNVPALGRSRSIKQRWLRQ